MENAPLIIFENGDKAFLQFFSIPMSRFNAGRIRKYHNVSLSLKITMFLCFENLIAMLDNLGHI